LIVTENHYRLDTEGLATMADQQSDGAVDAERHNKLQGAYQRALGMLTPEQREALKSERPEAPEYAQAQTAAADSQPELEDGIYEVVGGTFTPFEAPTPRGNQARRDMSQRHETTVEELSNQLDQMVGRPTRPVSGFPV
jgi:hypothetical protein